MHVTSREHRGASPWRLAQDCTDALSFKVELEGGDPYDHGDACAGRDREVVDPARFGRMILEEASSLDDFADSSMLEGGACIEYTESPGVPETSSADDAADELCVDDPTP